jgi:hypothetical protein
MKTSTVKFSIITVLLLTVISVSAQTKSTITIKSMTIQNGDTIVKEQTFQNDGNTMIYDSLFDNNSRFLYFNKDYNLDTNFNQRFSDVFGHEMGDFLKKFNFPSGNLLDPDFDFFNHSFPLDFDSILFEHNNHSIIPEDKNLNYNEEIPFSQQLFPYDISCEKMISVAQSEIENYSTYPDPQEGTLKVSFNLDSQKPTLIFLSDANNKPFCKEKVPKSRGIYTRLFDLTVYEPGQYYLSVTQGKKHCKSLIMFKKNNL